MPLLKAPSSIVGKCHYIGLRFSQDIFMPLFRALHYSGCHLKGHLLLYHTQLAKMSFDKIFDLTA